jgi:uncharacterized protein Yka (UPF0111/DUF47 family)
VRGGLVASSPGVLRDAALVASRREREADELVDRGRSLAQGSRGTQAFSRLLTTADDAADGLEEAAFLLTLLPSDAVPAELRSPLEALAHLVQSAAEEWVRCARAAAHAGDRAPRNALQAVLESADRVVTMEHDVDVAQRAVTTALFRGRVEGPLIQLLLQVSQGLEDASDALAHAALVLRDHLLDDDVRL